MNKFRVTRILLILVAILAVAYAICPQYLRTALIYREAGLDDYKIFDNRIVAAGNYQPWAEDPGFQRKSVPEAYSAEFEKLQTLAFLVVRDQKIRFEQYWDGYSVESKSNSFSMAKSIIPLLIGIALDDGTIHSVDQPVGDFLPEFREGAKGKVTIRHLLEMSSGLNWDEADTGLRSIQAKSYYGNDLMELAINQQVIRDPGKFFVDKGGDTQLLAMILEGALHYKVSSFASEKLWKPMGAAKDALWSIDKPNGIEKAFSCFYAGTRDFARFGQLILNQGTWNGQRLVSESYINQMLKPVSHLIGQEGSPVDFSGWHWWLTKHRGYQVYYMMGANGQYVIVFPQLKTVIVRLGRKSSAEKIAGVPADLFTWMDAGLELSGS